MAQRIQRKRTKGWKMPENTVYVGRPTVWGNPFIVSSKFDRTEVVKKFREWILAIDADYRHCRFIRKFDGPYSSDIRAALRGKDLACWCPLDQPCHADVLLEIANRDVDFMRSPEAKRIIEAARERERASSSTQGSGK